MYGLIVHQDKKVAVSGGWTVGAAEMCTCTQIYLPLLSFNVVSKIYGQFTIGKRETNSFSVSIWFLVTKIRKL